MLVTFTTEAYADITMFGDVAVSLLKMMGHSGSIPGAIRTEDIPAALEKLNVALAEASVHEQQSPDAKEQEDDEDEPKVSINTRALPLIDLLAAAAKAGKNVMWN